MKFTLHTQGDDAVFDTVVTKLNQKHSELKTLFPDRFLDIFESRFENIIIEIAQSMGLYAGFTEDKVYIGERWIVEEKINEIRN